MPAEPTVDVPPRPAPPVPPAADSGPVARARRYSESRAIALRDFKLIYLPVPKAGCTSLLWLFADLGGVEVARFNRSTVAEVTLPMTVHDMWVWGKAKARLADLDDETRQQAFTDDAWMRFTVVRDPARRLWSAWQSKILLREPRFVAMFGEEPWFPGPTSTDDPDSVLEQFRAFVVALAGHWDDEAFRDPHWTLQADIVGALPITHVGRLEQLDDTMEALRAHLGPRPELERPLPQENRMPLPYAAAVYDEATAALVNDLYARDLLDFDYSPVVPDGSPNGLAKWRQAAQDALPVVTEVVARHERLGALADVVRKRSEDLRSLRTTVSEREEDIAALRDAVAEGEASITALGSKLSATSEQLAKTVEARDAAQAKVAGMLASKSWKVTAPLRRWSRRVRRG